MVESIKELREVCQKGKIERVRRISVYLTKLLLYTPITANQVTLLMTSVGIAIGILFSFGIYWYSIIGALLFPFYYILDHVDGEIARYRGTASLMGSYIDQLSHNVIYPFIFVGISFGVYANSHSIIVFIFGFSASIFLPLKWLVYFERVNLLYNVGGEARVIATSSKPIEFKNSLLKRMRSKIVDPTSIAVMVGVILIGAFLNYMHLVIILYGILMPCSWILNVYSNFKYMQFIMEKN